RPGDRRQNPRARSAGFLHGEYGEPRSAAIDAPDDFDITRENSRHIAFGYRIHLCVGAPLARMEGLFALAAMMKRKRAIELGDSPLTWRDSLVLRGLSSLPIRFKPA
ncbi:MAG: hypothetical protein VXW49_17080, partial [Pseudomonadota bacterium]|nr:hypothetical protein [Pseudomonadota bacterium]